MMPLRIPKYPLARTEGLMFRIVHPCAESAGNTQPGITQESQSSIVRGGPVPGQLGLVSTGIDPMRRGPASLEGPLSLQSQRSEQLYRD